MSDFYIDQKTARRRFERAARRTGERSFLAREVARRMFDRLVYIKQEPREIADIGCGIGEDFVLLEQRYPHAQRIGIDFATTALVKARGERSLLQRLLPSRRTAPLCIAGNAQSLPLSHNSVGLVWSNLLLQWLHDPMPAFKEMHRIIKLDGLLMFSTLGPDSLKELRAAMPATAGERVHRFIDMHDLGDCLIRAGFAEPVMDMEVITVNYETLDGLFTDLRSIGATNASTARPQGLTGKAVFERARQTYESLRREGRLPATFEVVYGHAWKAAPKTTEDGRAVIQFRPYEKK